MMGQAIRYKVDASVIADALTMAEFAMVEDPCVAATIMIGIAHGKKIYLLLEPAREGWAGISLEFEFAWAEKAIVEGQTWSANRLSAR